MEFAVDQALKIYSGGLGFLSGSHMRSAYQLNQNIIGIGMLWSYGYYDQTRNENQDLQVNFTRKKYTFLKDVNISFNVTVFGKEVLVKAYLLEPNVFNTAPIYLLSTDFPENDYLSRTITHHLYDPNEQTRIAQSIVLGIGGGKLMDIIQFNPSNYHMNEGHALPIAYHLFEKFQSWEEVKSKLVFTTHTPEKAGNETHSISHLKLANFFQNAHWDEAIALGTNNEGLFDYTLAALRMARRANAVSKIHGDVSRNMWNNYDSICEITHITNAQDKKYWHDPILCKAYEERNNIWFIERKKELKKELFKIIADQTGDILDPEVLTIVWARRFAGYKRPDLILHNFEKFEELITRLKQPIQFIWAGKPYPHDTQAITLFNKIQQLTQKYPHAAILTGYELSLSRALKLGADIWLNNPRFTREASGTSGMTAAMNGALNLSNFDGWVNEFGEDIKNAFIMDHADIHLSHEEQDAIDAGFLYNEIENEVIPIYYNDSNKWMDMVYQSMDGVFRNFDAKRMADEYYKVLYKY
jgi:starch phosphorylase